MSTFGGRRLLYRLPAMLIALGVVPAALDSGRDHIAAQHGGGVHGTFTAESCYLAGKPRTNTCVGTFRSDDQSLVVGNTTVRQEDWPRGSEGQRIPAAAFPEGPADRSPDIYKVGDTTAGFWAVAPAYVAGWLFIWAVTFWVVRPLRPRRAAPSGPPGEVSLRSALGIIQVAAWVGVAISAQGVSMWALTEVLAPGSHWSWAAGFAALHAVTVGCLILAVRATRAARAALDRSQTSGSGSQGADAPSASSIKSDGTGDLALDELRAFLSGDDTYLDPNKVEYAWSLGSRNGRPTWPNRYSEIVDGRLLVQSRFKGTVGEFRVADLACIANLPVPRPLQEGWPSHHWAVDRGGLPVAEIPWGEAVQKQAEEIGLPVRMARRTLSKKVFEELRPKQRLVR